MRIFSTEVVRKLQKCPHQIRNICILAHVDHGKTTLADSLVASNGIISPKMAGKLRYMDSRKDEQERGITMKSSSIALVHTQDSKEFLINLIDSPGHVDFSSEVSTAVRLCDGAIVVVDVVEGVCPQTQVALKQAWMESICPVLVLNKMDRLILEMKLTPLDAYVHLTQVLEQVNAVMGELFTTEVLGRSTTARHQLSSESDGHPEDKTYDWSSGLEDADDSQLYFSPEQGNVVFASAVDGWGFSVQDFAKIYAEKLGVNESVLQKTLWGDYYLHAKQKRVMKGAQEKAKKPLFVQMVLDNIWSVYDTIAVRKERDKVAKIADSLGIKLTARDLRHTDARVQLQAVFSQWLPLARTVLDMACARLPAPCAVSAEKAERLVCRRAESFDCLPAETRALRDAFLACSSDPDAPVIVYISKMFPVERKNLPQNRPEPLSAEEMARRREVARQRHAERLARAEDGATACVPAESGALPSRGSAEEERDQQQEDVFVAFARVFSGTVRRGRRVYVLGPKHDPAEALDRVRRGEGVDPSLTLKDLPPGRHVTTVVLDQLFLMMGRELETLDEVPAGNVLGIGGLDEHVLKSATLSSTVACPAFAERSGPAVPIVRVAVEPARHADLPALVRGLRLLNQADACVQVIVQETGEHVLVTAGEVHLQRCLEDLRERYARVAVNASEPIVPFRETVVSPPTVDMVNEAIQEQREATAGPVAVTTPNRLSTVRIRAVPLPPDVAAALDRNAELLKTWNHHVKKNVAKAEAPDAPREALENVHVSGTVPTGLSEKMLQSIEALKRELREAFASSGGEWADAVDRIWSFGPRGCGPNVLLNRIPGYDRPSVWERLVKDGSSPLLEFDSSFVSGFQLATLAGPLCEEPMMGVCFVVEDWTVGEAGQSEEGPSQPYGPFSGQVMSAVKEGCRRAFQVQPQRLMAAMYTCLVQVNGEVLGKMYAVLGRRHGRVLHGDMTEGSASFSVTAVLPVVESFAFAPEIRKQTSGLASPQLVFTHWEVIDQDPFWRPSTQEEYLHYGEKADAGNRARRYMDAVRRRKGLAVDEKLVEFGEKQRTLSRNK